MYSGRLIINKRYNFKNQHFTDLYRKKVKIDFKIGKLIMQKQKKYEDQNYNLILKYKKNEIDFKIGKIIMQKKYEDQNYNLT